MDDWPATLPQSVTTDYEMIPRDGLMSTTEFCNPVRNRTYPEWTATFSMIVSSAQLAIFRTFYDTALNQSAPFTVPWLSVLGFSFYYAQFSDDGPSWKTSKIPGYWELTLPLDVIAGVEVNDSDGPDIYPPEESS